MSEQNPPADDVREALRDIIRAGSYSRFPNELPYADVVDRILSDPRFEVRLRGTVTDAEPTDAQILAGLNAEGPARSAAPSLDFYAAGNIARMRNVLRAAAREARS